MQQMVLMSGPELRTLFRDELNQVLSEQKSNSLNGKSDDQLLKRTDVAQMFEVSLVTVHAWMKSGTLPFHRIGRRTFFKKNEVMESLSKVKIRKK